MRFVDCNQVGKLVRISREKLSGDFCWYRMVMSLNDDKGTGQRDQRLALGLKGRSPRSRGARTKQL